MIVSFFNRKYIVKKQSTGKIRRFTSTATVDANVQEDIDRVQLLGADYGTKYVLFCGVNDPVRAGYKLIDKLTGKEYMVDSIDLVTHPITGTDYCEARMTADASTQTGGRQ